MHKLGFAVVTSLVTLWAGSAVADSLDQGYRWGVGLRTTSQNLAPEESPDNKLRMEGGGLQIRYRLNRRFTLELSSEKVKTREEDSSAYARETHPVTFTALWHMSPNHRWDWYLIFGVGGTNADVTYRKVDGSMATASSKEAHVHLGVGIERMFCRRIGVGAELRAVGLSRSDSRADDATAPDPTLDYGPVPANESGGQFNLTATYYW